jgi:hypothetical protein
MGFLSLSLVRYFENQKKITLRKLDMFSSSGEVKEAAILMGFLEKGNLKLSKRQNTVADSLHSPEDGNRSSFRNVFSTLQNTCKSKVKLSSSQSVCFFLAKGYTYNTISQHHVSLFRTGFFWIISPYICSFCCCLLFSLLKTYTTYNRVLQVGSYRATVTLAGTFYVDD